MFWFTEDTDEDTEEYGDCDSDEDSYYDSDETSFSINQLDANNETILTIKIHKDTHLHSYLSQGNQKTDFPEDRGMCNIDDCADAHFGPKQLPQGEPKIIRIGGREVILFSYFRYGMKASIFGWCLTEGREVLQLAGACFFMHQIHQQIIIFCPPHICQQVID